MNKGILKSKMILYGDTNKTLALAIGISPSRLSAKINEKGGAEFTQKEIKIIINRYKLTNDEVEKIFFEELDQEQEGTA